MLAEQYPADEYQNCVMQMEKDEGQQESADGCSTSMREPNEDATNPTTVFAMPYIPNGVCPRLSWPAQ